MRLKLLEVYHGGEPSAGQIPTLTLAFTDKSADKGHFVHIKQLNHNCESFQFPCQTKTHKFPLESGKGANRVCFRNKGKSEKATVRLSL